MEFHDGPLGLINCRELDKAESLGAMGLPVGDYFHILHRSDPAEEFEEIALGGVKGEIANIDTRGRHLDPLGLAGLAGSRNFGTFRPGSARRRGFGGGRLLSA
jgi:hypothetical protein